MWLQSLLIRISHIILYFPQNGTRWNVYKSFPITPSSALIGCKILTFTNDKCPAAFVTAPYPVSWCWAEGCVWGLVWVGEFQAKEESALCNLVPCPWQKPSSGCAGGLNLSTFKSGVSSGISPNSCQWNCTSRCLRNQGTASYTISLPFPKYY